MALPLQEVTTQVSALSALVLVILLLVRHVLKPRLTESQQLAFDVAVVPLMSVLAIFVIADFLGALP